MLVRPQLQGPQLPQGNLLPTSASGQKEPLAHGLLQEGPTDAELEPQLKGAVVTCRSACKPCVNLFTPPAAHASHAAPFQGVHLCKRGVTLHGGITMRM